MIIIIIIISMIVCHCHNVNESAIWQAATAGIESYAHLKAELNIGTCCGQCEDFAQQILQTATLGLQSGY